MDGPETTLLPPQLASAVPVRLAPAVVAGVSTSLLAALLAAAVWAGSTHSPSSDGVPR